MLPALAREAIRRYSQPGELVLDPMCGIGTTLVEAIHLGRQALGVELEPRWAALAAGNVLHAETQGADGDARSRCAVTHVSSAAACSTSSAAACTLILTSPPYGPSTHGHVRKHADRVEKLNTATRTTPTTSRTCPTGRDRARRRPDFDSVVGEILAGCARMLDPERGRLVLTVRPYRAAAARSSTCPAG